MKRIDHFVIAIALIAGAALFYWRGIPGLTAHGETPVSAQIGEFVRDLLPINDHEVGPFDLSPKASDAVRRWSVSVKYSFIGKMNDVDYAQFDEVFADAARVTNLNISKFQLGEPGAPNLVIMFLGDIGMVLNEPFVERVFRRATESKESFAQRMRQSFAAGWLQAVTNDRTERTLVVHVINAKTHANDMNTLIPKIVFRSVAVIFTSDKYRPSVANVNPSSLLTKLQPIDLAFLRAYYSPRVAKGMQHRFAIPVIAEQIRNEIVTDSRAPKSQ